MAYVQRTSVTLSILLAAAGGGGGVGCVCVCVTVQSWKFEVIDKLLFFCVVFCCSSTIYDEDIGVLYW